MSIMPLQPVEGENEEACLVGCRSVGIKIKNQQLQFDDGFLDCSDPN